MHRVRTTSLILTGILITLVTPFIGSAENLRVPSLTPDNRASINNFCNFHPNSGLCYFTPNPVPRPPGSPPGGGDGDDPGIPPISGGPPPVLCTMPTDCRQTVSGTAQLQSALSSAACGCEIVVSPGAYSGTLTYNKTCSASAPLMVRAASSSGVIVSGLLQIRGTYGIFQGFNVSGKIVMAGDYNRITRMLFYGNSDVDFEMGATYNRFDRNDVIVNVSSGGENDFISFLRPRSPAQMYAGNRIDTNYWTTNSNASSNVEGYGMFHGKYGAQDGYEDLRRYGSFRTTIENNLFENWGRKNVLESKSHDNIFRNNTLINTGRVLNRHGGRNLYQGNYFQNITTGLAIREFDNQIINNYFDRARLILYKGTRRYPEGECFQSRDWMPTGYQAPQGPPAVRTIVDKNRGPLVLGDSEGSGCDVPVLNTRILCHEGSIQRISETGTTGPTATSSCGFTMPTRLTRAQVGRGAPETGCSSSAP